MRDEWFKKTLSVLNDKESYIIDNVETLKSSVKLLSKLIEIERQAKLEAPVLLEAEALSAIQEQLKAIEPTIPVGIKYLEDEIEKDAEAKEAYEAKRQALKDLEEQINLCQSSISKS